MAQQRLNLLWPKALVNPEASGDVAQGVGPEGVNRSVLALAIRQRLHKLCPPHQGQPAAAHEFVIAPSAPAGVRIGQKATRDPLGLATAIDVVEGGHRAARQTPGSNGKGGRLSDRDVSLAAFRLGRIKGPIMAIKPLANLHLAAALADGHSVVG